MEEPVQQQPSTDGGPRNGGTRGRKRKKHHGLLHLHRAQRKMLARAAVFLTLLVIMLIVWYWMTARE